MGYAATRTNAGDTVYLEDGVANTTVTGAYSSAVNVLGNPGGTADAPIAFVAYPGANATIGSSSTPYAVRVPEIGDTPAYYVFAGLNLRAAVDIADGADHISFIGNDESCSGTTNYACIAAESSHNIFLYGNNVHNTGNGCADNPNTCKLFHSVYFTTDTNHVWVAWNVIDPDPNHTGVAGCRGLQFNSTGGSNQYDLHVHDNVIRNTICDAINFATVNPDNGTVEAYNNAISHAGTGPDPSGNDASYACISTGGNSSAPVAIYNNSFYDCGARVDDGNSGAFAAGVATRLQNNIVVNVGNEPYIATSNGCAFLSGSSNDFYGTSLATCPQLAGTLSVNPQYANASDPADLQLQPGSPVAAAGTIVSGDLRDIKGQARSVSSALGAYQGQGGSGPSASGPTPLAPAPAPIGPPIAAPNSSPVVAAPAVNDGNNHRSPIRPMNN